MGELILDNTKLMYHKDRLKAWLDGEKVPPITVEWALSKKCSYRCIFDNYCYTVKDRATPNLINKKIAYRFLDSAAKIGVKATPLGSDGESTLNPIIYDVIPYATEVGLDTAISTNAYSLDDSKLDKILPHLKYLKVNIASANPDMYSYIMGCHKKCFGKVIKTIEKCVKIKKENNLGVTIGLQMVLMPEFYKEIIPLAQLGRKLEVDYTVIKHCAENRKNSLGIKYEKYRNLFPTMKEAESYSTDKYHVVIKWSKMRNPKEKIYDYCYGPIFLQQVSASGFVGPCGTFFGDKMEWYNLGDITKDSYEDIYNSKHYWEVLNHLGSDGYDNTSCWNVCFQHKANEFLWRLKTGQINLNDIKIDSMPEHVNFI